MEKIGIIFILYQITLGFGEIPYQVSLQTLTPDSEYRHFCGGSLVTPTCVVTAAQCVTEFASSPNTLFVAAGSPSSATRYAVSDVQIHPNYNQWVPLNNDIAVVNLRTPVFQTLDPKPINLPKKFEELAPGTSVNISGWGYQTQEGFNLPDLYETSIIGLSRPPPLCASYGLNKITEKMLCADRNPIENYACAGDTGGPLVTNHGENITLFGVASWNTGCPRSVLPGVYTKVSHQLDFLAAQNCLSEA